MSIIDITIIETSDFIEFQPNAESKYTEEEITSAINLSHTLLDAEVGGAITDRWNKTSTEEGYLTDTQKLHIKKAYLIETQYVLMNGLDFSQGSDQFSLGSFNMSSNRPNRNLISPQALKELQLAGIWYQTDFVQARNGAGNSIAEDFNIPLWNDEPLSETTSDARYVHKQAESTGSYDKILKYDTDGVISYLSTEDLMSNYYTKSVMDTLLANKSQVSVSEEGTSAEDIFYINVDGVEYRIGSTSGPASYISDIVYSGNVYTATRKNGTNITWEIPDTSTLVDLTSTQTISGLKNFTTVPTIDDEDIATIGDIPSNYVTTDTTQNISGEKDFTSLKVQGIDVASVDDVPTKTSDLTNDSGFITNTVDNLTNYTKSSNLATVATSGSYTDLINKPSIPDAYTKTETDNLLSAKQNTLTAGTNISITGNTISATDTTYTAGTGIDITNNAISIDNTVVTTGDAQSISGAKTFTNNITLNKATATITGTSGTTTELDLRVNTATSNISQVQLYSDGNAKLIAGDGTNRKDLVFNSTGTLNMQDQFFVYSNKISAQTRDTIKTIAASYGKTNICVVIPYVQFTAAESPDGNSSSNWFIIANYWSATNVAIRAVCNFKNVTATSLYYTSSWGDWNTEGIVSNISSTVTLQTGASGTITLYKCGKMRRLIFKDILSTNTGTVTICLLPSDSRPIQNYEYFVVNGVDSGASYACDFGTNGYVHIYGYDNASYKVYGSITYFVS